MIKLQRYLMALFMFIVPVAYPLSRIETRVFQQNLFQYGGMILCSAFVGSVWVTSFMAWVVYTFWYNGATVGAETVSNIFIGIMLFGLSRKFFLNFKFDKEAVWIGRVAIVSMLFMVFQSFGIDPIHSAFNPEIGVLSRQDFADPVGIMYIKAHNGILMALFSCYMSYIAWPLGALSLVLVAYSESSGAMLAAIVGVLFSLYFYNRKIFLYGIMAVVLGGAFFFLKDFKTDPKMFGSRLNIWHATARASMTNPVGYGPDSYRSLHKRKNFIFAGDEERRSALAYEMDTKDKDGNPQFRFVYYHPRPSVMYGELKDLKPKSPNVWDHPHNEYLNIWFCFGYVGIFIIFMQIKDCVRMFKSADKTKELVLIVSMLLVYAVSSLTQFPLCVARLGYLFPIILGAFFAVTEPKVRNI